MCVFEDMYVRMCVRAFVRGRADCGWRRSACGVWRKVFLELWVDGMGWEMGEGHKRHDFWV